MRARGDARRGRELRPPFVDVGAEAASRLENLVAHLPSVESLEGEEAEGLGTVVTRIVARELGELSPASQARRAAPAPASASTATRSLEEAIGGLALQRPFGQNARAQHVGRELARRPPPALALHGHRRDRELRIVGGRHADEPLVVALRVGAVQAARLAGDRRCRGSSGRPPRVRKARRAVPRTVVSTIQLRSCAGELRREHAGAPSPLAAAARAAARVSRHRPPSAAPRAARRPAWTASCAAWSGVISEAVEAGAELAEREAVVARIERRAARMARRRARSACRSDRSRASIAFGPTRCTAQRAKHWLFEVASALRMSTVVAALRRLRADRA